MKRININTHNLPIDENKIEVFKARFGNALKEAPSDSTMCCCIMREDKSYTLNMRVHSATGHIPIHCEASDVDGLVETTLLKMSDQFKRWHSAPKFYAENHKFGEKPCYRSDKSVLTCPIGSYANEKFEKKEGL